MRHLLPLTLLALASCSQPESHPYRAIDGDTIDVGAGPNIRLAGIDAPELGGRCRSGRHCVEGIDPEESRATLQAFLDSGRLVCDDLGPDRYGRRLANCTILFYGLLEGELRMGKGSIDLSQAMLDAGMAEPYRR